MTDPLATPILREPWHGSFPWTGMGKERSDPEDRHVLQRYFSTNGSAPFFTEGTYVELGAGSGVKGSNTHFFDAHLRWSGLLIEPSAAFERLRAAHGGNARNTLLHEAVCNETDARGEVEWVENNNTDVSGVPALLSKHNQDRFHSGKFTRGVPSEVRRVPCRPLFAMLRAAKIDRIDFFSLDCEGCELQVLQTMDWAVPVRVLVVELDGQNAKKDEAVRVLLREHGMRYRHRMGFRRFNELWESCVAEERPVSAARQAWAAAWAGRTRPECVR